jgi:Fe-S-cluster containining protein
LRLGDGHLLRSGKIPSKYLYTIREGELLFDKDQKKMVPVSSDNIKIKINEETMECLFLNETKECDIYSKRPLECRAFKCWDTLEIEMKYKEDPLIRHDVLSDIEGLWDLISEHQDKCSYKTIQEIVDRLKGDITEENRKSAIDDLNEIINYDTGLRSTLIEKAGVDPEMISFLIGRPLTKTIVMFNYIIEDENGKRVLKPIE